MPYDAVTMPARQELTRLWPAGERLSHRGYDWSRGETLAIQWSGIGLSPRVPNELADEIARIVPHCERLTDGASPKTQ